MLPLAGRMVASPAGSAAVHEPSAGSAVYRYRGIPEPEKTYRVWPSREATTRGAKVKVSKVSPPKG